MKADDRRAETNIRNARASEGRIRMDPGRGLKTMVGGFQARNEANASKVGRIKLKSS